MAINNFQCKRSALTLIELLIVMGLLTLLATFSLSGMRDLMRSQKVTQASTLVKQYLQNAQIRAITNGRPVAVFLDRVSMVGDRSVPVGNPNYDLSLPANYTVTRLQFGEVFPAYVGDLEDTVCGLGDSDGNRYVDFIFFGNDPSLPNHRSRVISGFGFDSGVGLIPGFLRPGDMIQIEGSDWWFEIDDFITASNNDLERRILVPLKNPRQVNLPPPPPPQLPEIEKVPAQLPMPAGTNQFRRFKVYRQPTKSLVGSVSLPRGTCVDLSLSGQGPISNGCQLGEFSLGTAPSAGNNPSPSDFSRIGIVFDAQGRVSYLMDENSLRSPARTFLPVSSTLYLLVGRTDQVVPGLRTSNATPALAALQAAGGELPPGNLLDPENVWITCNPFTGEIKSSPMTTVVVDPNQAFEAHIRQGRLSAIAGLSN